MSVVSEHEEELNRAVVDALADTERSAAQMDRWLERLRSEGAHEVEPNYLPLDMTYTQAQVVGVWPGTDVPVVEYLGCEPTEE